MRRSLRRSNAAKESVDDSKVAPATSTTEVAQRPRRYSTLRSRSKPQPDTIVGFMDSLDTVVLPETTQRKERVTHAYPGELRVLYDKNQSSSLSDAIKLRAQKLYPTEQSSRKQASSSSDAVTRTSRMRAVLSRKYSGITEQF